SCPGEDTLRTVMAGELQDDPFKANASGRLVVTLSGAPRKGQVRARAELRNAAGRVVWDRELGPDRCQAVLSALGFALAVSLEQGRKPTVGAVRRSAPEAHPDRTARSLPRDRTNPIKQTAFGPWAAGVGGQLAYGAVPDGFAGIVDAELGYRLPLGRGFVST